MQELLQATGVPIERYSFETVGTTKDWAGVVNWRRQLPFAQARLADASEAELCFPEVTLDVLDVSSDALCEAAGQLLRQSADYQAIIRTLSAKPGK